MPTNVSEMNLEDMILAYLRDKQGYEEGTTNDYVKEYKQRLIADVVTGQVNVQTI